MSTFKMGSPLCALLLSVQVMIAASSLVTSSDLMMRCFYGERGSLTATCFNANASYFKLTQYRFDQLDETLKCVNCSLQTLETGTFDISGNLLRNLIISNSHIEIMKQKAFIGLIFLENVDLSYNNIRSIYPGTFSGVKKIKMIDLSYNQIDILADDGFLELINLEELKLQCNFIKTISTKAFHGLGTLSILNLNNNSISDVKDIFTNLTSLKVLNLDRNQIAKLEGYEFSNLTSLLSLNLAYNKLQSPVIELANNSLRSLDLCNNDIKSLNAQFLNGLHFLERLDISYNKIQKLDKRTLQGLYKLRSLNISYNNLDTFETGTFTGLPQLESLNCSHNAISQININGVFSLRSIHALDLSHNKVNDLDYVAFVSRLPSLSYLRLEDNKLPCYLEDEMNTYFEEDNFKFVLYDDVVGAEKCVDTPKKASLKVIDSVIGPASEHPGVTGAEITIIVMICIIFVCIGFLFFLQFRTYIDARVVRPNRATSSVNLMSAEANGDD